jgi:hypothetical protein
MRVSLLLPDGRPWRGAGRVLFCIIYPLTNQLDDVKREHSRLCVLDTIRVILRALSSDICI